MEVTVSGVPRERREQLKALVTRLRGTYSGAFVVGRTAVVVVEGPVDFAAAPKLVVARANAVPIVSAEWLEASHLHGFLLNWAEYVVSATPGRRSSAASTSAGLGPPAPDADAGSSGGTGALPAPAPGAAAPASPENLRGEAFLPAGSPLAAAFIEHPRATASPRVPPAGGRTSGSAHKLRQEAQQQQQQRRQSPLVPDAMEHQLPSPGSPAAAQGAGLHNALPSPLERSPLRLPDAGGHAELVAGSRLSPLLPAAGQGESQASTPLHAADATQEPPSRPVVPAAAAACQQGQGDAALWEGSPASACGSVSPAGTETDSDTKVARFLSRAPHVTLVRGTFKPRMPLASLSPSGSNGAEDGSSGSRQGAADEHSQWRRSHSGQQDRPALRCMQAGGMAQQQLADVESPEDSRVQQEWAAAAGSGVGQSPAAHAGAQRDGQGGAPSSLAVLAGSSKGTQHSSNAPPAPSTMLRRWYTESVMRMRPSMAAGRLPATTLIRLGGRLQRPPTRSTLDGIAERHRAGSLFAERRLPVALYHSAEALPERGQEMRFVAGDITHGASILYDILEDGQRVYALTLVQSIYTFSDEAWFEHRYLFSKDDLLERPGWAAVLQGHTIRQGEVLLSAGSYHSPMHLISGEFWLTFPGHAVRSGKGQGHAAVHQPTQRALAGAADIQRQPVYACLRGFDAATGTVVPLRRTLDSLTAQA